MCLATVVWELPRNIETSLFCSVSILFFTGVGNLDIARPYSIFGLVKHLYSLAQKSREKQFRLSPIEVSEAMVLIAPAERFSRVPGG